MGRREQQHGRRNRPRRSGLATARPPRVRSPAAQRPVAGAPIAAPAARRQEKSPPTRMPRRACASPRTTGTSDECRGPLSESIATTRSSGAIAPRNSPSKKRLMPVYRCPSISVGYRVTSVSASCLSVGDETEYAHFARIVRRSRSGARAASRLARSRRAATESRPRRR